MAASRLFRHLGQQIAVLAPGLARSDEQVIELRAEQPMQLAFDTDQAGAQAGSCDSSCEAPGLLPPGRDWPVLSHSAAISRKAVAVAAAIGPIGFAHQLGAPGAVVFVDGAIGMDLLRQATKHLPGLAIGVEGRGIRRQGGAEAIGIRCRFLGLRRRCAALASSSGCRARRRPVAPRCRPAGRHARPSMAPTR
jgi:hypothetical protein